MAPILSFWVLKDERNPEDNLQKSATHHVRTQPSIEASINAVKYEEVDTSIAELFDGCNISPNVLASTPALWRRSAHRHDEDGAGRVFIFRRGG